MLRRKIPIEIGKTTENGIGLALKLQTFVAAMHTMVDTVGTELHYG
jgi:hypothetical protein